MCLFYYFCRYVSANRILCFLIQGKYAEAQPLFERALVINERTLGLDHPNTITSRAWMASLYVKQGFLDKAFPLMNEVLVARERVLGCHHPDVASTLNDQASLLEEQVRTIRIFEERFCGTM